MHGFKKIIPFIIIFLAASIYFFFPTINYNPDALGYAADIKQGKNLINGHHFLYHFFCYYSHFSLRKFISVLHWMQILNAIFTVGILIIIWLMFKKSDFRIQSMALYISAFAFGILRFATDAEVYIIPIFFSLLGSFYFFIFEQKKKIQYAYAGILFFSIGILFHQMHVFWAIAFFIVFGLKNIKIAIGFLLSAALIIGAYYIAAIQLKLSAMHFATADAQTGLVKLIPDFDNVKFFGINIFRSFFQIHGLLFLFIKNNIALFSSLTILTSFVIYFICRNIKINKMKFRNPIFKRAIVVALILHLLFALYSNGNAEFMCMVPVLTTIVFVQSKFIEKRIFHVFFLFMGIWNIMLWIIPMHFCSSNNLQFEAEFAYKNRNNVYIPNDKILLENYCSYFYPNIKLQLYKNENSNTTDAFINTCLKNNKRIFTNIPNYPSVISRKTMVENEKGFWHGYNLEESISYHEYAGTVRIVEIRKK